MLTFRDFPKFSGVNTANSSHLAGVTFGSVQFNFISTDFGLTSYRGKMKNLANCRYICRFNNNKISQFFKYDE